MTDFPRISIVTPSLNQGRFLRQCLDSVLSQEYPQLELFVIDGGSTDDSVDIIRSYGDQIDFWVSDPDEGQSDAINKGFRRASGQLVAWLNADDFYMPGALHEVAKCYSTNSGAPFYFGDGNRVDEAGEIKEGFFPGGRVLFSREALLFGMNYILQPSTFISNAHLREAGYLDETLKYGMDSDLWMKLSALGEPVPVAAKLSASREYGETKTSSGMFERVEELRQISRRHSGLEITPGVLCYYLHTLHRYSLLREDVWGRDFRFHSLEGFWKDTQALLGHHSARLDGFPESKPMVSSPSGRPASASDSGWFGGIKKLFGRERHGRKGQ